MRLSLAEMGANVLNTADGRAKTALSLQYAQAWQEARAAGNMLEIGSAPAPDHPARPEAPPLMRAKRRSQTQARITRRPDCAVARGRPYRAECRRSALGYYRSVQ